MGTIYKKKETTPFGHRSVTNFLDAAKVPSHVGEGRQKPPGPICIETLRKSRSQLKRAKGVVDDIARSAWATELLESFGRLKDLVKKKFEQQHGRIKKLGKKVNDLSGSVDAMQRTVHSLS
ncbi:hypothetical protein CJ030_MR7G011801 [Morella rubra]|uniref:Uncharacterized protein n=1 Tax=Morella rubra TaxID=262757 RepID=A0A6A1V2S6_9ROSI|nr:hypothetical protein CJ030_MR7G011801 [Morella rubra]